MTSKDGLDPGVRALVVALNNRGYRTTDSGDGVSKTDLIESGDALPFAHVAVTVDDMNGWSLDDHVDLTLGAVRDITDSRKWHVEASYDSRTCLLVLFCYEYGPKYEAWATAEASK